MKGGAPCNSAARRVRPNEASAINDKSVITSNRVGNRKYFIPGTAWKTNQYAGVAGPRTRRYEAAAAVAKNLTCQFFLQRTVA